MNATYYIGFYGKIPSNGDFVSRHLPRTFINPWDEWLQHSLASSHEQLGSQWLHHYLTSPIWRFALSRGACDDSAWTGLVMPSVDRVGRYFPLTLAIPVTDTNRLLKLADKEEQWFLRAEETALSALDQDISLDRFSQDIDRLGTPDFLQADIIESQENAADPDLANSSNWHIAMTEPAPVSSNLNSLMERLLRLHFPCFSLWWTSGSDQVDPSILICNKLPSIDGFSALLTGNWERWGWNKVADNDDTVVTGR